jgi:hypothetical protein
MEKELQTPAVSNLKSNQAGEPNINQTAVDNDKPIDFAGKQQIDECHNEDGKHYHKAQNAKPGHDAILRVLIWRIRQSKGIIVQFFKRSGTKRTPGS